VKEPLGDSQEELYVSEEFRNAINILGYDLDVAERLLVFTIMMGIFGTTCSKEVKS